jgi:Ca2+-binding RTX toxin-like protein
MLTLDEALQQLSVLRKGAYSVDDLMKLADQVTLDTAPGKTQGATTLLYSGQINGASSADIVSELIKKEPGIRVIDKTSIGTFLASEEFKTAFLSKSSSSFLFDPKIGPWAKASEKFVIATTGPVRFLGPSALLGRQFGSTELKAILDGLSGVTSVEGIPVAELRAMGLENAFSMLHVRSAWNAGLSGFIAKVDNSKIPPELTSLKIGDFLNPEILDSKSYILKHPDALGKFVTFIQDSLASSERSLLKGMAKSGARYLGIVAPFVTLGFAVTESAEAAQAGDSKKARQIMEHWAVDAAGSDAGAYALGAAVVAIAAGAAALTGGAAALSAPVMAAIGIAASVIGGYFGSEAATKAWESFRNTSNTVDLKLSSSLNQPLELDEQHYALGSASSDDISGSGANDYIAGAEGADVLNGLGGEDTLKGGDGADRLDGGAGSDTLEGGKDSDTYAFNGDFGDDTISDSDGQGEILVDDQPLPFDSAKKVSDNLYRDNATGWSFFKSDVQSDGSATLVISKDGSNSITVRNWTDGQLGINLGSSAEPTPIFKVLIFGDQIPPLDKSGSYAFPPLQNGIMSGGTKGSFEDVLYGGFSADLINGFDGNDALSGLEDADLIEGGAGNDFISGGDGNDTIDAGPGNDIVFGALNLSVAQRHSPDDKWKPPAGGTTLTQAPTWGSYLLNGIWYVNYVSGYTQDDKADQIAGGAGNDSIWGGRGADSLNGGDDDDLLQGLGQGDAIVGGKGNDTLRGDGTPSGTINYVDPLEFGNDLLDGGVGNDLLNGGGKDDKIFGGSGNDSLQGDDDQAIVDLPSQGKDYLDGEDGDDQLAGGGNDDELFGGAGNDSLSGDDIQDRLAASANGKDYLDGEEGNDQLTGDGNDDELYGGTGNDSLWGDETQNLLAVSAHGNDYLDGEEGNDQLTGGGNDDELYGGTGNDSLWGDDTQNLLVVSAHGKDYLDGEEDNDQLIGGGNDDELYGGAGNDLMYGDDMQSRLDISAHGRDYLDGENGNDQLIGGGDADTLYGGEGNDTLLGDDSQDMVAISAHGDDVLDGGNGNDIVIGGGKDDQLYGGAGNDVLSGDDTASKADVSVHGNDLLDGCNGNDTLIGGGGNDSLYGGSDIDILYGDDDATNKIPDFIHGNDELSGGDGNDTLYGGGGNDILYGDSGNDWLSGEDQRQKTEASQNSNLSGNDTLLGGAGNDTLLGGLGNDSLYGDKDADYLLGGAGNDILTSGEGDDYLNGGDSDDTLNGGAGNDTLIGGSGNDTFIFGAGAGVDAVYDTNTDRGNIIQIDGNSTIASITFNRTALGDLLLSIGDSDKMTFNSFFENPMNIILLPNGTTLKSDQITPLTFHPTSGNDAISGYATNDFIAGDAGNDTLFGGLGNDTLNGEIGSDSIYGEDGDDVLLGNAGSDQLQGGFGNDVLDGGAGSDTLLDWQGDNTYLFGFGDGVDFAKINPTITKGGSNTLLLRPGISADQIQLQQAYDVDLSKFTALKVSLIDSTESITFDGFLYDDDPNSIKNSIDRIHFANGSEWDLATILAKLYSGTNGTDTLTGTRSADSISGQAGNDSLNALAGDDTLDGGAGNDSIDGGLGNDIYLFGRGDGRDLIQRPTLSPPPWWGVKYSATQDWHFSG